MTPDPTLHPSQAAAIAYIRAQAITLKPEADDLLTHICRMSNIDRSTLSAAITAIQTHARVALHFQYVFRMLIALCRVCHTSNILMKLP